MKKHKDREKRQKKHVGKRSSAGEGRKTVIQVNEVEAWEETATGRMKKVAIYCCGTETWKLGAKSQAKRTQFEGQYESDVQLGLNSGWMKHKHTH